MKKIIKLGMLLLFTLTSCNNTSSSLSTPNLISTSSTSTYTISDNKEYQKDEEGFFILEDDYFKNNSKEDNKETSKVRFSDGLDEELRYSQLRMFIGDKEVPLFNVKTNMSQTWNGEAPSRMNNAVALLELEGKIEVKLQANFALLNECVIRPLSANITPQIDENRRVITFTISSPGQYTIDLRSGRTVHLFVNEYNNMKVIKKPQMLFIFLKEFIQKKLQNILIIMMK